MILKWDKIIRAQVTGVKNISRINQVNDGDMQLTPGSVLR